LPTCLIVCRTCAFGQEPNDVFAALAVIEEQVDVTNGIPANDNPESA